MLKDRWLVVKLSNLVLKYVKWKLRVNCMRQATTVTKSDVRQVHPRLKMLSNAPRFFDRLTSSSDTLRNSIYANSGIVTMSIYISSLRSFVSHYKATRFGRVLVLISQNKTSPLPICNYTVISSLEHCTESQWRYSQYQYLPWKWDR